MSFFTSLFAIIDIWHKTETLFSMVLELIFLINGDFVIRKVCWNAFTKIFTEFTVCLSTTFQTFPLSVYRLLNIPADNGNRCFDCPWNCDKESLTLWNAFNQIFTVCIVTCLPPYKRLCLGAPKLEKQQTWMHFWDWLFRESANLPWQTRK